MKLLRKKLFKEILELHNQLAQKRLAGIKVKEQDLPTMAAACMYDNIRCCGFSSGSKHIERDDLHYPFESLLEKALWAQDSRIEKIPDIIFYKQKIYNVKTDKIENKKFVDKFIGTCAEDNAVNCLLIATRDRLNKPKKLKQIVFDYPVRTRTFEREKMCKVCNKLFSKP